MTRYLSHILLTAAGVLIAAGLYEAFRAVDPPMIWPLALGFAGALSIIVYAIENLRGA